MEKLKKLKSFHFPIPKDYQMPNQLVFKQDEDFFGEYNIQFNQPFGRGRKIHAIK